MGTTRIEQAIDDFDPLADEGDTGCDDIRLAWLANELHGAGEGGEADGFWADR